MKSSFDYTNNDPWDLRNSAKHKRINQILNNKRKIPTNYFSHNFNFKMLACFFPQHLCLGLLNFVPANAKGN